MFLLSQNVQSFSLDFRKKYFIHRVVRHRPVEAQGQVRWSLTYGMYLQISVVGTEWALGLLPIQTVLSYYDSMTRDRDVEETGKSDSPMLVLTGLLSDDALAWKHTVITI